MDIYKIKMSEDCDYDKDLGIRDLSGIEGTNCYLDDSAREIIRERLNDMPVNGVHFIDSGNYHYMSLFFLERIEEDFSLIVFDNHTDYQESAFGGLTSCGGWIREADEKIDRLKRIYLIGTDPALYEQENFGDSDKIKYIDTSKEQSELNENLRQMLLEEKDHSIYISIDKDVLSEEFYTANWSQGSMTDEELVSILEQILKELKVIGIDICGGAGDINDTASNDKNRKLDEKIIECINKSHSS